MLQRIEKAKRLVASLVDDPAVFSAHSGRVECTGKLTGLLNGLEAEAFLSQKRLDVYAVQLDKLTEQVDKLTTRLNATDEDDDGRSDTADGSSPERLPDTGTESGAVGGEAAESV